MSEKKRPINQVLFYSLIVTVGLHLALVIYLFRHPLFFEPSFSQAWTKGMQRNESQKKSLFLEQALNQLALIPLQAPSPLSPEQNASSEEAITLQTASLSEKFPLSKLPFFSRSSPEPLPDLNSPTRKATPSADQALFPFSPPSSSLKNLDFSTAPSTIDFLPLSLAPHQPTNETIAQELPTPTSQETLYLAVPFDNYLSLLHSLKQEERSPFPLRQVPPDSLDAPPSFSSSAVAAVEEYLPDGPMLSFSDWSNYFNIHATLLTPKENEPCRFALTITPKDDLKAIQMKQNITFLIDRSNSIERHRFAGFKRAVLRALSSLNPDQQFNICLFDRKATFFSKTHLPATKGNIQRAQNFLATQEFSSSFSATELCPLLTTILPPEAADPSEMHIAILLTDGNAALSMEKQKKSFSEWLKKNHRKFSLYAAAVGKENNLRLLGMLTSQTGGEVLYSPTHAAFPRQLAKLVRDLSSPLAHELVASVHGADGAKLLTPSSHLPALFNNKSFTLYGTLTTPTTLTIALQGMHATEPMIIQKEISFDDPPSHIPQLEKGWMEHTGWSHFASFLKSGKKEALKSAHLTLDEADAIQTQPRRRGLSQ